MRQTTTKRRIAANSTWKHIEQFFLGQFEVYYSKLNWSLVAARREAYTNTITYFSGNPSWTTALEKFQTKYEYAKY
jgi:hypothetical protein